MLQPARTKYRKAHKGRIHGRAGRGEILNNLSKNNKEKENAATSKNKI